MNLKMKESIHSKRYLNFVASLYESQEVQVNPYYMMKYDCRSINDIITIWYNNETFLIIAACSDCYIRVFNQNEMIIVATIKGIFGSPLCLDVSQDNTLLAAGYEDDTFIIYGIKTNFLPLCRGVGHHSFVS